MSIISHFRFADSRLTNRSFIKYCGSGNDFILIDRRDLTDTATLVEQMAEYASHFCRRQYSIGADGLLLLSMTSERKPYLHFFNPDGSLPSFCGNGMLSAAHYLLEKEGLESISIECKAGVFSCFREEEHRVKWLYPHSLQLPLSQPLLTQVCGLPCYFIECGVPHAVILYDSPSLPFEKIGKLIRHHPSMQPEGCNVTFCQTTDHKNLSIRSYERGVERVTEACGSGAVAASLCAAIHLGRSPPLELTTSMGFVYTIDFSTKKHTVEGLTLSGHACPTFSGTLLIS